jgi:sterol 24-C-methyltransferase
MHLAAAEALTASRRTPVERKLLEMSGELLSTGPEAEQERRVRSYFLKPESRILYRLVLGGTKHFGYYPAGSRRRSMAGALRTMEDKLGTTLALAPGLWVLDAGCGEGDVAIRMATEFGLHVEGVDLLELSLDKARKKARRRGLEQLLRFHRMDYANLSFPDQTFDGAYTMETLVHAFDHERALQELLRVLKPGGKLALFEYSIAPRDQMSAAQQASVDFSVEGGAMPSLPSFVHGAFPEILERAGFVAVSVTDITERMLPMLKRFAQIGYVPCRLGRLLRLQGALVNCTAAVQVYRHRSVWRYNIVTAERPR